MAEYKVLSWRGIPAQVKAYGEGGTQSATMPDRYQTEIDRVAMREGLAGSDAYLEQWKWGKRTARVTAARGRSWTRSSPSSPRSGIRS